MRLRAIGGMPLKPFFRGDSHLAAGLAEASVSVGFSVDSRIPRDGGTAHQPPRADNYHRKDCRQVDLADYCVDNQPYNAERDQEEDHVLSIPLSIREGGR